tara:strand:- start:804 stop:1934 length:1131 start_codon:yes stop_codon:yes gene_type:complete
MIINKDDIEEFITNYEEDMNTTDILIYLMNLYTITTDSERYVLHELVQEIVKKIINKKDTIKKRRNQLNKLKKLKLPDQRSKEWYEMRKNKLTASSLASAIGHCHFQSRDELILSKIEEKPFEPNPITEWGVKYEDIAIMFYEELYHVKVLDFGCIPHPKFDAFGASPDGICDDTGNDDYIARMVEIKCPPKRKFTKTVPGHYLMQVQGQLEVCDLDECDFFQVKIMEYDNYEDYCKDTFEIDDTLQAGRTSLNYPKGVVLTYKEGEKLSYKYSSLNQTDKELLDWVESQTKENIHEIKWWRIDRYECTLVKRDREWWMNSIDKILQFYIDLLHYRKDPDELEILKKRILESKKRKKKIEMQPLNNFQLISDNEED